MPFAEIHAVTSYAWENCEHWVCALTNQAWALLADSFLLKVVVVQLRLAAWLPGATVQPFPLVNRDQHLSQETAHLSNDNNKYV